jgi:hypothetical protein
MQLLSIDVSMIVVDREVFIVVAISISDLTNFKIDYLNTAVNSEPGTP